MSTTNTPDQIDLEIDSYSQRRKLRESQPDFRGQNIYGGERCQCPHCSNVHWKPIAKVEEMTK